MVPECNGEDIPLSVFLEGCDEAKEMVAAENEANLTELIRSKLTGEAREVIYGQAFANIEQLKDFIKTIYAPAKTIHQLLGEMGSEYPKDHEMVIFLRTASRTLADESQRPSVLTREILTQHSGYRSRRIRWNVLSRDLNLK